MRITPSLPGRGEIIGRDSGHHPRLALGGKIKIRLPRPDVRAVSGHENRYVAKQQDAPTVRVSPQFVPLLEEHKLLEAHLTNATGQPLFGRLQGRSSAITQIDGPILPPRAGKVSPYGHEQGEVLQPALVLPNEILVFRGIDGIGLGETIESETQTLATVFEGCTFATIPGLLVQPAALDQPVEVDHQRISGMRR